MVAAGARRNADPQPAESHGALSARAIGRHEAARHDRPGARLQSRPPDRRRADDGARRDRPGADPGAHRRAAAAPPRRPSSTSATTSSLVRRICDRVAVMYAGQIAEIGETGQLFEQSAAPLHARPARRRSRRRRTPRKAGGDRGHRAGARRAAALVPLRRALPLRGGRLLDGRPAARADGVGGHTRPCFIHHSARRDAASGPPTRGGTLTWRRADSVGRRTSRRRADFVLSVRGLEKYFPIKEGAAAAGRRACAGRRRRELRHPPRRDARPRRRERLREDDPRPLRQRARAIRPAAPSISACRSGVAIRLDAAPRRAGSGSDRGASTRSSRRSRRVYRIDLITRRRPGGDTGATAKSCSRIPSPRSIRATSSGTSSAARFASIARRPAPS